MGSEVRYKVVWGGVGVVGEDRRGYSDISPLAATKTNTIVLLYNKNLRFLSQYSSNFERRT